MEESQSTAPVSRRSFLASGVRAGIGVAGVGLGLGACSSGRSPLRPAPGTPDSRDVVRVEPPPPPDHSQYVTRPDLTPPGISVRTDATFATSGLQSSYIFCAPKSPTDANPGQLPSGHHAFPSGATPGLMILDTTGELVWFKPLAGKDTIPFNFRVQTYDGEPTLTWFEGTVTGGHATAGHYVLADNKYNKIAEVKSTKYPCDLHEFILTPEGTALHTAYEPGVVSHRGVPLVVGHAQEIDVATNDLLFDWPCYPAVSPDQSYTHAYGDYFHINSINLWPGRGRNLLISSRNTCAVYLVDRRTKRVLWRVGGKRSDFALGPGASFYFQHDARPLSDGSGISLFDDASQPCPETDASGKVLTVDQSAMTATLSHRYFHTDRQLNTPSQGNCQLLPNGGHVVGWGYVPFFSAFGASPDTVEAPLILDGRFPEGADSYRTFLFDWTGHPPRSELRFVVHRLAVAGQFTAWVSWNGATEVAKWQLEAGSSSHSLETIVTVRKQGFETSIDFSRYGARVFEVAALDASGRVIGRSDTISAT